MNVALYLRYSSDRQTEQSIEGQQRVCEAFCKQNGHQVVKIYIDRALSASKDAEKRLQFQQMIRDSDKRTFEGVVVYKLDRFARNRYDSATYKAKLSKNGVRLISATEGISNDIEGIILESVLEGMAEYYSKELSQKVNRGLRESALKGNSLGGSIPTGYKVENKKFVIDEAGAEIVREVYALFVSGMSIAAILRSLKNRGIRNSRGNYFSRTSIEHMLVNRRYIGVYSFHDIEIEGGIPAIMDKETFEQAQNLINNRKSYQKPYTPDAEYLLSGRLFCGECGDAFQGESGTGRSKVYYYYICQSKHKNRGCTMPRFRRDELEEAVVRDAFNLLHTPGVIEQIAEIVEAKSREEAAQNDETPMLRKQLNDCNHKIENLLKLAESGVATDSILERLKELEEAKKDYTIRIREADTSHMIVEKDHVLWWLRQFSVGDPTDQDFRRLIINMLIHSVTIYKDPNDPDGYKIKYVYTIKDKYTNSTSPDTNCEGAVIRLDDCLDSQSIIGRTNGVFSSFLYNYFSKTIEPNHVFSNS